MSKITTNNSEFCRPIVRQKIKIGAHLGKKVVNSELEAFVLGSRSEVCIMDIKKILLSVYRALYVLKKVIDDSGHISILNTNLELSPLVKRIAHTIQSSSIKVKGGSSGSPVSTVSYCNEKWLGGTLTNWEQISKSLEVFARLRRSLATCELTHYVHAALRVRAVGKKTTGARNSRPRNFCDPANKPNHRRSRLVSVGYANRGPPLTPPGGIFPTGELPIFGQQAPGGLPNAAYRGTQSCAGKSCLRATQLRWLRRGLYTREPYNCWFYEGRLLYSRSPSVSASRPTSGKIHTFVATKALFVRPEGVDKKRRQSHKRQAIAAAASRYRRLFYGSVAQGRSLVGSPPKVPTGCNPFRRFAVSTVTILSAADFWGEACDLSLTGRLRTKLRERIPDGCVITDKSIATANERPLPKARASYLQGGAHTVSEQGCNFIDSPLCSRSQRGAYCFGQVSPGSHRKTNPWVTKRATKLQGFAPIQKAFDQRKWNRIRAVLANNSIIVGQKCVYPKG
ncbi:ribosomal protein S2 (mitochondrion) [Bryopsis sp. KO-2023]|nr:ribosomal protein S2 [Bryopsis sp. KO-2023]